MINPVLLCIQSYFIMSPSSKHGPHDLEE